MTISPWFLLLVAPAGAVAAVIATGRVTRWLRARAILDHPNARSSHRVPTPRGGGIGLLAALLPALALVGWAWPDARSAALWPILAAAAALGLLSFLDDRRGLPAGVRFAAQIAAIALGIAGLPGPLVPGLLPHWLEMLALGFAWAWFVNLYNFMDGSDGITGSQTLVTGIGLAAVAFASGGYAQIGWGLALAGTALGFLRWNWHPARVFLGDVGSVPLGFLIGWLLLQAAYDGAWTAALILPAYYWLDASWTLLIRALRGAKVWQAHREHAYQRALQVGWSHDGVARRVASAGLPLMALAYVSADGTLILPALALAAFIAFHTRRAFLHRPR